jgi:hypothetical protein
MKENPRMNLAPATATSRRPAGNRSGYLCLPQPDLAQQPQVTLFCPRNGGHPVAVVNMDPSGRGLPAVHVEDAAGARALAAAFTEAARLLDHAATEDAQ